MVVLLVWSARGVYGPTGDEPHYLMIADALWSFRSIDVEQSYINEFANPTAYPPGLAPPGSAVEPPFAHTVTSAAGVTSFHSPLLGWLLAVPYALFGVLGAKVFLLILSAPIVVVIWRIANVLLPHATNPQRFIAALAFVFAYPLMLAAGQIFPDVLAGGIVLYALYWLLTIDQPRSRITIFLSSGLIALLPWLGLKFTAAATILLIGLLITTSHKLAFIVVPLMSAAGLVVYQLAAFGAPLGGLRSRSVVIDSDFPTRFLGLILDQNQGFLFYQPLLWLGIAFVPILVRRFRFLGIVWVLTFLALIVPVAGHPVWYGSGSFIGRFGWPLAMMMILPTMLGLQYLWQRSLRLFTTLIVMSLLFSSYIYALHVFYGGTTPGSPLRLNMYNNWDPDVWLETYAKLSYPLQDFFPAFYSPEWVWNFAVNWVWIASVVIVLFFAALKPRVRIIVLSVAGIAVIIAGVTSSPGMRVATAEFTITRSAAGPAETVLDEPVRAMRDGNYAWSVTYASPLPNSEVVGTWQLYSEAADAIVAEGQLPGTAGNSSTETFTIPYRSLSPGTFAMRVYWYGSAPLSIESADVRRS